ncbi:MAG: S8 family serine peptidase [Chthoniobacterales bacterium]
MSRQNWRERLALPEGITLRSMHEKAEAMRNASDALPLDRPIIVELNGALSVPDAVALLQKNSDVVYAEPDYIGRGGTVPNDPNYSLEWYHPKIQSEAAWSIATGSNSVIVAVLDSGVDASLSEFSGRLLPGHDYANNDNDPADDYGHGTEVISVLAANANNNQFIAGMDWQCRILPEKILDANNFGLYSWWAQATYDATDAGAKVINLSAGGTADSQALTDAINYAISKNAIFITITHNQGTNAITFPGRLTQCITVGGTEHDDTRASFSNYGPAIDLVAPARDIYVMYNDGTLRVDFGTSFSAPLVAGVASIVASLKPGITQRQMEQLLCASAQDQVGDATDTPGWDQYYGFGRLNANYAVTMAASSSALPEPLNVSTRGFVSTGDGVLIGGFILTGAHAKNVIIRAIGPSLATKVPGVLQDPTLDLYDSANQLIVSNDNWRATQESDIMATGIPPTDDRESAIVRILEPGEYTAIVRGAGNSTGIALVEAYDLQPTPNSQLANISTRGFVGTGDNVLIGGFIVGASSHYVVRGIGPSLSGNGLTSVLADPVLALFDANGNPAGSNDNWMTDPNSSLIPIQLRPTNPNESAMYVTLAAGPHTAIVSGKNGGTGIGLVEAYTVP